MLNALLCIVPNLFIRLVILFFCFLGVVDEAEETEDEDEEDEGTTDKPSEKQRIKRKIKRRVVKKKGKTNCYLSCENRRQGMVS